MNPLKLLFAGIVFLIVGAVFFALAVWLRQPKTAEQSPMLSRVAGSVFSIIGSVTCMGGLLSIFFRNDVSKMAVQIFFLLYLVFLTIMCFIFVTQIKDKTNGTDNTIESKS